MAVVTGALETHTTCFNVWTALKQYTGAFLLSIVDYHGNTDAVQSNALDFKCSQRVQSNASVSMFIIQLCTLSLQVVTLSIN